MKFTEEQGQIYRALSNPHVNATIRISLSSLKQRAEEIFGYDVFLNFTMLPKKNLYYYLSNIIFHTQFVTYLAVQQLGFSDGAFERFYENVAEFCLVVVQGFYLENKKSGPIYTEEFKQYIRETIVLNLTRTVENTDRILLIFRTNLSIITYKSCLTSAYHDGTLLKKSESEKKEIVAAHFNRVAEDKYIVKILEQFESIANKNKIKPTEKCLLKFHAVCEGYIKAIETDMGSLDRKSFFCIRASFALLIVTLMAYGVGEIRLSVFCLSSALVLFSLTMILAPQQTELHRLDAKMQKKLEDEQRNLKQYQEIEVKEYVVVQEEKAKQEKEEGVAETYAIYGFKEVSNPLKDAPLPSAPIVMPTETQCQRLKRLRSKYKEKKEEKQEIAIGKEAVEISNLPQHYYRHRSLSSANTLLLFEPDKIKKHRGKNERDTPDTLSIESCDIVSMNKEQKLKWSMKNITATHKVRLGGGKDTRYFGHTESQCVNGQKLNVLVVTDWVPKAHTRS